MSKEDWFVAEDREDGNFVVTTQSETICSIVGGNTLGEQIDYANRIAKVPQLERKFARAKKLAEANGKLAYQTACELAEVKRQRDALADALEMVRDADEDCHKDGLPTIPPVARHKIDMALATMEGGEA